MAMARANDEELRRRALHVVEDLEAHGLAEDAAVVRDLMARVEVDTSAAGELEAANAPERTYSLAEAAFIMGIPESLAEEWCERGRLNARRSENSEWRIPVSQFVHTPEEVQRIEAMWADIERQGQEAGWPEMTDEEFMEALRLNDGEPEDASERNEDAQ